jgi:hypothetical protein
MQKFLLSKTLCARTPIHHIHRTSVAHFTALSDQSLCTAICFGQAAEEKKERKETNLSKDRCFFRHRILHKTVRVITECNSGHRAGSVAIGPDALRGRLREFENILVLVQIKDENWTKYQSNLSKHFSYMYTDIDPPVINPPVID